MALLPDEAIMRSGEIPPAAFRLYAYYCMRRNADTGACFPSLKTAQTDLAFKSYSYTSEVRSILLTLGWIELTENGHILLLMGFKVSEKTEPSSEKTEHVSEISEVEFGENRTHVRKKPNIVSENSETLYIEPNQLTSPINQPNQPPRAPRLSPVVEIFEFWRESTGKPSAKLTRDREAKVRARLKEGYSVEDIKQGIAGCRASPFHRGENDRGMVYDDLMLICRSGAKLESFMALRDAPKGVVPNAKRTASAEFAENYLKQRAQESAERDHSGDSGDEPSAVSDRGGVGDRRREMAHAP